MIKDIIISTINGEKHLGDNIKKDCIKYIEDTEIENKVLDDRLKHLLESDFISEYDRKNPLTSNYELDIKELDKIMEEVGVWEKKNPSLHNSDDDFVCTFDELLNKIKQGYKRIKVTRELYAELEDKLYNVKHNNEDPISSFFGIEIYVNL